MARFSCCVCQRLDSPVPIVAQEAIRQKGLAMTKFILLRHGHVEGIKPALFRGRLDLALTEKGRQQAELTAQRISTTYNISGIYTSPLNRSVATANAISAATGADVEKDARLIDIDYGAWQGLTREEAASKWPDEVNAWYRTPHVACPQAGETLQAVLARVAAALHGIASRHPNDTVVVVGHDSVNRVILLHALELPLSHYWRIKQDPCAISELEMADGVFTVWTINESWHLRGTQTGDSSRDSRTVPNIRRQKTHEDFASASSRRV